MSHCHVSKNTVKNIKKQEQSVNERRESMDRKLLVFVVNIHIKCLVFRKKIVVDSFTEGVIRRKILEHYAKKEFLTMRKLHSILTEDTGFPKMSYVTLWRICKQQLKFKHLKFQSKPIPFEREDITIARHSYLRKVRYFRRLGYKVKTNYYTGILYRNLLIFSLNF